jgi:ribosomal protein L11 methyltransferase
LVHQGSQLTASSLFPLSHKTTQKTYEVALFIPPAKQGCADVLLNVLESIGIPQYQVAETWYDGRHCLTIYHKSLRESQKVQRAVSRLDLTGIRLERRALRDEEWKTLWKKEFLPFSLTGWIDVVPLWQKTIYRPKRGRLAVYIDTQLAFGTGLHPTTRFIAGFIERCHQRVQSLLDIGTGTGLLVIVAAKYGVPQLAAVDIDPGAAAVAEENFQNNAVHSVALSTGDFAHWRGRRQYDLVAANLTTEDLVTLGQRIVSLVKPGKYLAVSGVSRNNYLHFRRAFQPYPLKCLKVSRAEGWTGVLFKKN